MFWRTRKSSDFRAEVDAHIQLEIERFLKEGLSEEEAYQEARRAFGNASQARERFYESRRCLPGEALLRDVDFGLRLLVKHPGSTAIAALTLALVIGMNTAIFSVVHTALFKPLPISHPDELVMLTDPDAFGVLGGVQTGNRYLLSYAEFAHLRDHATSVSGLCASGLTLERWQVRVSGGAQEEARGRMVSENYFSVLGVEPVIGRFFGAERAQYAVISYDYWQRRFGGNPAVIGTPIRFYRTTMTVIGVAARGFRGETVGQNPDVWLPIPMQPLITGADMLHDDTIMWLHAFGRLKPGVTAANVQAEMNVLFRRMLEGQKSELNQRLVVRPARSGVFPGRAAFSVQWTILSALAGLVLLLACANIANLLLARAAARSREIAIRLSIGASRGRLIRQLLTESLLLAGLGGSMGILAAAGGSRALTFLLSRLNESLDFVAGIDHSAFAFSACATLFTGILFGMAPALRATRRVVTSSWQRLTFAKTLVVAQVALSLLLVVGAGLFLRTLWNLQSVALGYPRDNLLLLEVDTLRAGYDGPLAIRLDHDLADRIRLIPGVRGVTWSAGAGLFTGTKWVTPVSVEGFTPRDVGSNSGIYGYTLPYDDRGANKDTVGPGYFSALGIPILLGREIGPRDIANSQRVCVINEAFARRFFAGRNPIGKHVISGGDRTMEVVGVAENARDYSLRGKVEAKIYMPADQNDGGSNFQIRTAADPNRLVPAVRRAILAMDADLPVKQMETLRQVVAAQNAQPQLIAQLSTIFGVFALVLAASGIYGVLSHGVARRTNEIGIRVALGAGKARVAGMILRETGVMVLAGVVTGVAAAAACVRLVAAQLYGLSEMDPLTIAAAAGILGAVALIAGYVPAARAARVDPMRALRHE